MTAFFEPYTGTTDLEKVDFGSRLILQLVSSFGSIDVEAFKAYINENFEAILKDGGSKYLGATIYPLLTDANRRVLLGFDTVQGTVIGAGLVTENTVRDLVSMFLGADGLHRYDDSGSIVPVITDANRRVLLGYDKTNQKLVGAGLASTGAVPNATAEPLAEADRPVPAAINHLLFYGQSLSVGATATTLLSTTQPYSNLTFNGGPRAYDGVAYDFSAFKPLVEDAVSPAPDGGTNRGETCCSGAANYASTLAAIENGLQPADHVILSSTAGHGGWRVDQLDKGGTWYSDTFLGHVNGAFALNPDYAVHAVGFIQGENDSGDGTTFVVYRSGLNQLQIDAETDIKAITGQTTPVYFLTYQVRAHKDSTPDPALAQLDLAQTNDRFFLVAPIYHIPRSEGTHLTSVGYKWLGAYFGRAYKRLVIDGLKPQWLNPVSATLLENELRIRFEVPVGPMVLDTTTLAVTQDHGFAVEDTVGAVAIDKISIDGNDVVLTLAATPTGATTVRYALDYLGAGITINNGASGNLRDSASESVTIDGTKYPLYNVAPSFSLPVIVLGV